jgi:hypothetical protein
MNFEVYCDESCQEVLSNKSTHKFLLLGSLWFPSEYRSEFKEKINTIKITNNYNLEIKWNKVSPITYNFYKDLVEYFFQATNIRFRALVVESEKINLVRFHSGDAELSFYKFYYQMLHNWIYDFNEYEIFLDLKRNKGKNRINKLKEVLINSNLSSVIKNVQALPSRQSLGIQLCDLLLGAVNGKFNNSVTSNSKLKIIEEIERLLGNKIAPTSSTYSKFNIFKIGLQGGW